MSSGTTLEGDVANAVKLGSTYEGEFKGGFKHGQGVETFSDGKKYEGGWKDNTFNGHGIMTYPNGETYEGERKGFDEHGQVIITYPDGTTKKGEYVAGELQGTLQVIANTDEEKQEERTRRISNFRDGKKYKGGWKDNTFNGHGIMTFF